MVLHSQRMNAKIQMDIIENNTMRSIPRINKNSLTIANSSRNNSERIEDRLLRKGKTRELKIQNQKEEQLKMQQDLRNRKVMNSFTQSQRPPRPKKKKNIGKTVPTFSSQFLQDLSHSQARK